MRTLIFLGALLLVGLAGCTSNSLPPETNPAEGREALKRVLDTWVQGGKPDDLRNARQPIVTTDPDWETGHKLTKYEIDPAESRAGVDLVLTATLHLRRADGKPQEKKVPYTVAVGAQTVVLRKQ
jgi:hypothetical protein